MSKILHALPWGMLIIVCCCTHDPLFDPIDPPSDLGYSPDSMAIQRGQSASSSSPILLGSRPFTFNLNTVPANGGAITIDETGIIHVNATAATGKYSATVVVINAAGSVSFPGVYQIRVYDPPTPPSGLEYTPAAMNILEGNSFTSPRPAISGSAPFTFEIVDNPAPDKISIDDQGIISTTSTLTVGTYSLTIRVTNSEGSETFSNALVLNVTNVGEPPSALSYSTNSISIDSGTIASSVIPAISGTAPFSFSVTSSPDAGPDIIIDNYGVITAKATLPSGFYSISVVVTNSIGSTEFPAVYTISVNEVQPVTFTNDVLPLINQYCSTCHTTGPKTIYSNYDNAVRDINLILDRVQRKPGSAGFMPKNGTPLTTAQIDILKTWLAHGLIE